MEAVKEFDEAQSDKKIKIERHVNYEDNVWIHQTHKRLKLPLEAMLDISPICSVGFMCNSSGSRKSGYIGINLEFLNGSTYKLYESNYHDDYRCSKTTLNNSEFLLKEAEKFANWIRDDYIPSTIPNQNKIIKIGKALGFTDWISKPELNDLNPNHTYFLKHDWGFDYVVDINDPSTLYIYSYIKDLSSRIFLYSGAAEPNLNTILGKDVKVIINADDLSVKDVVDHFNGRYNTEFEDIGNNTIRNNLYDIIQGLR